MQIETVNIILYCAKWEEMVAFYQTTLGLQTTTATDWFVEFRLAGTSRLSVADEKRTSIKSGGGKGITIGLQVPDALAARDHFVRAGLNPTAIKEVWGAQVFYIFDPEGNRIELWSGHPRS